MINAEQAYQIGNEADLRSHLRTIIATDGHDYPKRNLNVYLALAAALRCGYPAGIKVDEREPEWPVAFIDLPTGQVSWHLPQYEKAWDGHSTAMKSERVLEYLGEI